MSKVMQQADTRVFYSNNMFLLGSYKQKLQGSNYITSSQLNIKTKTNHRIVKPEVLQGHSRSVMLTPCEKPHMIFY